MQQSTEPVFWYIIGVALCAFLVINSMIKIGIRRSIGAAGADLAELISAFPEVSPEALMLACQRVARVLGVPPDLLLMDQPVAAYEKYFPYSDMLYENVEDEFGEIEHIESLLVKDLVRISISGGSS